MDLKVVNTKAIFVSLSLAKLMILYILFTSQMTQIKMVSYRSERSAAWYFKGYTFSGYSCNATNLVSHYIIPMALEQNIYVTSITSIKTFLKTTYIWQQNY